MVFPWTMVMILHQISWFNQARMFGPTSELPNLSESCLALVGYEESAANWLSGSEDGDRSPPSKMDSDKFDEEAGDQTGENN